MELTDFLLARLAEDEDDARGRLAGDAPVGTDGRRSAGSPERVLAACTAQRHVVDAYVAVTGESAAAVAAGIPFVGVDTLAAAESTMASMQLVAASTYDRVLRWYAEVHADHPDYREDWRP
ncbi:DUF6221 family protein [Cellulomonas cellasea]|uniref:Uncharacterized protein n=2 Tax=Cellulomonas cellasea TaxID=43670 RepID=A0A0A0B8R2_9CELL|nr:DUF6221 family protein [Cellulomonas cellasea]KGM03270.1 hypothetical protein Q760_07180 [Cellulomonas cellasea DSM 20118]GEA87441.1 hypothetical protein CCE01nite_13900 [Cellulomonas cellasea]